ncbi:hypothetical protein HBA54_17265 [Pelagibius litoralis]|uniref:Uncharacterized protein n=1 Tax=Pelagibius litoralis TaxID=374515 RepID=A0A967EZP3_9PROT|nr:hypothetical protein [Pelagibius litoralis]NIA70358.1 hypothetical protein [Pelagibius litoralis]
MYPVASATRKALQATRMDGEGFKTCSAQGGIAVAIGPKSVDRVSCIVDVFARALDERGYRFAEGKEGVRILVGEIPVSWRIHETRDKTEHHPTKKELERQAQEDKWRARWPRERASDRKVYRTWDYFPSGRLAMTSATPAGRRTWCWFSRPQAGLAPSGTLGAERP